MRLVLFKGLDGLVGLSGAVHWIAVATAAATTAEAGATVVTFVVAAIVGAAVGSGRGFRRRGLGRPWSRWRFCRRE